VRTINLAQATVSTKTATIYHKKKGTILEMYSGIEFEIGVNMRFYGPEEEFWFEDTVVKASVIFGDA
jgi:hypothetical protein